MAGGGRASRQNGTGNTHPAFAGCPGPLPRGKPRPQQKSLSCGRKGSSGIGGSQKSRRCSCLRYDQFLVIRDVCVPCTHGRQVSWLRDPQSLPPSRLPSGCAFAPGRLFPHHSDEIAQDFHLFPFYPLPCRDARHAGAPSMFDAIAPSIANPLPFGKRSFPRRAQNGTHYT